MTISAAHGVGVDEAALVKMLLFERSGDPGAYAQLAEAVMENSSGKPEFLRDWEDKHAPLISAEHRLSSEGAELLAAILDNPEMSRSVKSRLEGLARAELQIIMDRVLEKARQEQEWGTPPILDAAIVLCEIDATQGTRFAAFLAERPPSQIKAAIVLKISGEAWAPPVFEKWKKSGVSAPVKKAIDTQ
jgi:predicted KAP-like P-loop ATPase